MLDGWLNALEADSLSRLRWRVLRAFGTLPTDPAAEKLDEAGVLWCGMELLLDLGGGREEAGGNPGFDRARYLALKGGGGK